MLCAGTGCVSSKSFDVQEALQTELQRQGLQDEVAIIMTGCNGFCAKGPVLVVQPDNIFYQLVAPEDVPELVEEHFKGGRPVERLMYREPGKTKPIPKMSDIQFFKKQQLIALRNRGLIDPEEIDQAIARGAYTALDKALNAMTPDEIIRAVEDAGLRGKGGAGFATGTKWKITAEQPGDVKYVICNADEGDPGAFMDRSIIESDPHAVIEGMIIGARAMGANKGFVYIRQEYPLARERLARAIGQARERGLLGKEILGSDFDFDIAIHRGAGAFVCGEETALIASIEGDVGEPRTRPPFPAESGLWGRPTCINNVETWATVPEIIRRGPEWFSGIGTEKSKGTKVFALVGSVGNAGLVEVPMGITMRELVFDIGGGIPNGKRFKAVQTGGPSGGCIPESLLDLPIDFERLKEAGSIMGSGGMVVMDEDTCMVDVARYFLEFLREESCGKCTPCREGTVRMHDMLTAICEGRGTPEDIKTLEEMAEYVRDTSLCGLGATAPNPVLSTLRYFRDEYEAHVHHRQCPSRSCPALSPAPCQSSCPAGIDVPSYVALIALGRFQEALDLIREDNPFPAVCGYVCTHPCESSCKRRDLDSSVAIKHLKRFVADWEAEKKPAVKKGEPIRPDDQVAIVGAGPAGLTAACFLARQGYAVTVFDAMDRPGGMLVAGIPAFRLPRSVIEYEIERIASLGVKIETGVRVGEDVSLAELRERGFKALYLAVGAYQEMRLEVPGEELPGVIGSLAFLEDAFSKRITRLDGHVLVIGGGNAAIDCARTALRLGPEEVTVVYRRSRQEMPADADEIEAAEEEGVKLRILTAPVEVQGEKSVTGMKCIETELGEPDASGRRRPVPVEGSEFTIEASTIITAIGQVPETELLSVDGGVECDRWHQIVVDPETAQTSLEWVFAGGDAVTGPATVIEAVCAGKKASKAIMHYLQGEDLKDPAPIPIPRLRVEESTVVGEDERAALERPEMPTVDPSQRVRGFELVDLGLSEQVAVREAHRCLRCDINR
jgi:NADH-quinone oxidoreductase subunit F